MVTGWPVGGSGGAVVFICETVVFT